MVFPLKCNFLKKPGHKCSSQGSCSTSPSPKVFDITLHCRCGKPEKSNPILPSLHQPNEGPERKDQQNKDLLSFGYKHMRKGRSAVPIMVDPYEYHVHGIDFDRLCRRDFHWSVLAGSIFFSCITSPYLNY